MPPSDRLVWLDALRLMAGLSMVGLHATSDPAGLPFPAYPVEDRVAPMLLRAVLYIARTELFIIISLFLLLQSVERRPRPYGAVIGEQARRLLVPFLFWAAFFTLFNEAKAWAYGYPGGLAEIAASPLTILRYLVLGEVKYHMHFLPTLFGVVLLYPCYRLARRHPALGFGVIACLVIRREVDIELWARLPDHPALPFLLRAVKIASYAGYGLVAGAMAHVWANARDTRLADWLPVIWLAAGLLFLLKLAATWRTIADGSWPHSYGPGYWADFLMPVLLFLLCLCLSGRRWPGLLSRLAPYSFGIYLCHPIFLDLCEIALAGTRLDPVAQVALKIAVAVTGAALLVAGLARLPALAWTIGLGPLPFRRAALPAQETGVPQ
jgi:surface polysaccharide O-acyltransferase-like enzyme